MLALGIRLAYLFGWQHPAVVRGDPYYYHYAALLLAEGRGWPDPYELVIFHRYVPDAQHPPLTSALLALPALVGLRTFLQQQVFACLLGSLSVGFVGLAGRRVAGPTVGLVAALLAAVYPGMWINDPLVMSETTGILSCSLMLWLSYRFWERQGWLDAALLGVAAAAAALARAELILLTVLLVGPLILRARATGWRCRLRLLLVAAAACGLAIAPWAAYDLGRFDKPEYLSTGLGSTLAVTSCGPTYSGPDLGFWDFDCALRVRNLPVERSRADYAYRAAAYRYVRAHERELPKVAVARTGRTWGLFRPFQQIRLDEIESRPWGVSLAALISLWLLLPAAVAGAVLVRRRGTLLLPLLALPCVVTLASSTVYGTSRSRAVAEPAVVLLAAVAVSAVARRLVPRARRATLAGPAFPSQRTPEPLDTGIDVASNPRNPSAA